MKSYKKLYLTIAAGVFTGWLLAEIALYFIFCFNW